MADINLFELACRKAFRFPSPRGELTTEQLWSFPLVSDKGGPNAVDLNGIAIAINTELKSIAEESFVVMKPNLRKIELEQKLEIVKHVIASKQADIAANEKAAQRRAEREKLIKALAEKQDAKLGAMTEEEIRKRLDELDAA